MFQRGFWTDSNRVLSSNTKWGGRLQIRFWTDFNRALSRKWYTTRRDIPKRIMNRFRWRSKKKTIQNEEGSSRADSGQILIEVEAESNKKWRGKLQRGFRTDADRVLRQKAIQIEDGGSKEDAEQIQIKFWAESNTKRGGMFQRGFWTNPNKILSSKQYKMRREAPERILDRC